MCQRGRRVTEYARMRVPPQPFCLVAEENFPPRSERDDLCVGLQHVQQRNSQSMRDGPYRATELPSMALTGCEACRLLLAVSKRNLEEREMTPTRAGVATSARMLDEISLIMERIIACRNEK